MQGTTVHLPQMTKANAIIIGISAGLFILDSLFRQSVGFSTLPIIGLSWSGITSGLITQLITYPFAPSSFIQVLFSGLILWFLGCELERQWGVVRYLFVLSVATLIGGLIYLSFAAIFFSGPMAAISLAGLAGISSGLCLIYAILYPDRQFVFMFLFPMKAKYFCMLLIGITLYQGIFSPAGVLAWGHLGVMFGAFIGLRLLVSPFASQFLAKLEYRFSRSSGGGSSFGGSQRNRRSTRTHLKIVRDESDDDDKKPPKYWQ